jgi:hypothetical protein
MANISSNSKVAYMYDSASDMWYAIAGVANTNVPYTWTQAHIFGDKVTVNDVIKAKGGVNIFQNPSARDAAITSPTEGTVCFVEQTDGGTEISQIQYYNGIKWIGLLDTLVFAEKTSNHTLVLGDAGKTLTINSGSDTTITIPLNASVPFEIGQRLDIVRVGAGEVSFVGASVGVIINSKNSNKKIAARYSGATLIKYDTNTWVLIGDLKA